MTAAEWLKEVVEHLKNEASDGGYENQGNSPKCRWCGKWGPRKWGDPNEDEEHSSDCWYANILSNIPAAKELKP